MEHFSRHRNTQSVPPDLHGSSISSSESLLSQRNLQVHNELLLLQQHQQQKRRHHQVSRSHSDVKRNLVQPPPPALASLTGRHSHEHLHGNSVPHIDPKTREIEELRTRCNQMEKTMRWWADCTANWREKWSKVRSERNQLREECKRMARKLDTSVMETSTLRRELDFYKSKTELGTEGNEDNDEVGGPDYTVTSAEEFLMKIFASPSRQNEVGAAASEDSGLYTFVPVTTPKSEEAAAFAKAAAADGVNPQQGFNDDDDPESNMNRFLQDVSNHPDQIKMLQLRFEEMSKTLHTEREDKMNLLREIEELRDQLTEVEGRCDDLRLSRQESSRELLNTRNQHQEQLKTLRMRLEDEQVCNASLNQTVAHLREEFDRLQCENVESWGRMERLETEKQILERENKKMKKQIEEFKERIKKLTNQNMEQALPKKIQEQLEISNQELRELHHQYNLTKMNLREKSDELIHAHRKSDAYEKEVKRLRLRIDQVKKELAKAEEQIDSDANSIRKLRTTNEDLVSQVDSLSLRLEHLNARLHNSLPMSYGSIGVPQFYGRDEDIQTDDEEAEEEEEDDDDEEEESQSFSSDDDIRALSFAVNETDV